MSFSRELSQLFARDLFRLQQELQSFPDTETVWRTLPGISNSAGNLVLHLEGNLREFIGRLIGNQPYERKREFEFSARDLPMSDLLARVEGIHRLIPPIVEAVPKELLEEPFPALVSGATVTHRQALFHLYSHFSYHLGQIDYLRRALTGHSAVNLKNLAT